ncbi:MAG: hypothetical protein ACQR33_02450 [Candidatus Saccharibacteria bacterium]
MTITTTEQILLIVLGAFLALFLLLAIAVLVAILRFIKTLRDISQKAERVITSAESVTELFRKASGPMTILHFVRSVADTVAKHKETRKDKE